MFREYTNPMHVGSYLAGVATAVLLAVAGWFILQAQPFAAPVTSPSGTANVEALDAAGAADSNDARWVERDRYYEAIGLLPGDGDLSISTAASREIIPVDRKLLDKGYLALLMGRGELDSLANVDPADRKFFVDNNLIFASPTAGADPFANVNPADRKFFTNNFVAEE
jgi:hypothetical protein